MKVFICVVAVIIGVVARAQIPANTATAVDAVTTTTAPQVHPSTNTHNPQVYPSTNTHNPRVYPSLNAQSFQMNNQRYPMASSQGYPMANTLGYPSTNTYAPGIPITNTQGYPMANTQGYPMTNTQGYPMANNQGYQMTNDLAYPLTVGNGMSTNGYQGNTVSNNNGYQGNTNNLNSYMLPMMLGMDQGRHTVTHMGMMTNSRQGNNMLPFYMMNQGYEDMLPMMAFMNHGNQRGQRMNPFMMMTLHDILN